MKPRTPLLAALTAGVVALVGGCAADSSQNGLELRNALANQRLHVPPSDPTAAIVVLAGRLYAATEIAAYCPRRPSPTRAQRAREPACGLTGAITPPEPALPIYPGEPVEFRFGPGLSKLRAWISKRDFDVRGSVEARITEIRPVVADRSAQRWHGRIPDDVPSEGGLLRFQPTYKDWDNAEPASFALRITLGN